MSLVFLLGYVLPILWVAVFIHITAASSPGAGTKGVVRCCGVFQAIAPS